MITVEAATGPGAKRRLPKGWRWCKLDEVGHFESGGTPPKANADYWGGTIPFVTGADITEFYITSKHARAFLTQAGLTSSKTAVCHPGTILLVTRTRVGRVGIATETIGASQDLTPYSCGPDLFPEYACWYLKALSNYLSESCRGATIQGLTRDFVQAIDIPLPHPSEQKRIAAILKERLAGVQGARAAAETQLEAAMALPAAYLRAIFNSPEALQWPRERFGEILELRKEIVHPHDNPTGPGRFVGLEHIESGTGIRNGEVLVELSRLTGRKPRFYKGDIVYGYLRPYLNKVWIAEFDGLCSVDQYVYHVDGAKADTTFIAWFMRSQLYLDRAPIDTTPGQLPRIRTEEVSAVELSLPPLSEQHRIAAMLKEKMAEVERLRKVLVGQLNAINKLPGALLHRAFNGEL